MRLPLIKHITEFIRENDEDWVVETVELLEHLADSPAIKEEELAVIGELMSNLYGALEVNKEMKAGTAQKDALNNFMSRVTGSLN